MNSQNLVLEQILNLKESSIDKQIDLRCNTLKTFKLDNKLNVLLIHNPSFEDSAAMLTIDAGSIYDPYEIPGLAHLVGNLIFRESKENKSNSELFNFHFKNGGKISGNYALERLEFCSQNKDEFFVEGLDLLINAISNPQFKTEDCFKEIEIIEYESRITISNVKIKIAMLSDFLLDDSFRESRFINGNRSTLNFPRILDEVKNFHKNYFKANRMQLVIKSKIDLVELEKIAERFGCIPMESDIEEYSYTPKKIKLRDNRLKNLLNYPVDAKLKEKYRGKIIKFPGEKNKIEAYIFFTLPSQLQGFTPIHLDYIIRSMNQQLKTILNKMIKNYGAYQVNYKRRNKLFIVLQFYKEDYKKINSVIALIYEYLRHLKPSEMLFEEVKKNKIANLCRNTSESDLLKTYSEYLFFYSTPYLGEYEASIQFDEKVFRDLFNRFSDLKNWTVFVSTDNSNLPNLVPNLNFNIGEPSSILIEESDQEFFRNTKLEEYKPISQLGIDPITKNIELKEIEPKVFYFKRKNGQFTMINNTQIFGQFCEIMLTFVSPSDPLKNRSNNLCNRAILKKIRNARLKFGVNVSIKTNKFYLIENNFIFKIHKDKLPEFLRELKFQIKYGEFNNYEINEAKDIEIEENVSVEKSGIYNLSKMILPYVIKKFDYDFQKNYDVPIVFSENYFLLITAVGNITVNEVENIYQQFKSNGTRDIYEDLDFNNKSFSINNAESDDNSLVMAYHILAESKLKEFAIACLLKELLTCHLFEYLRYKNSYSISNQVDYIYLRQSVFLTISLRTLEDTDSMKDKIKNVIQSYSETIENISEKDLCAFKKLAMSNFDWEINTQEKLFSYAFLSSLIGIHGNGLQNLIKKQIDSLSIKDLIVAIEKFAIEPIAIHGNVPENSTNLN